MGSRWGWRGRCPSPLLVSSGWKASTHSGTRSCWRTTTGFWSAFGKPDLALFRRGGAPAALADSSRNGNIFRLPNSRRRSHFGSSERDSRCADGADRDTPGHAGEPPTLSHAGQLADAGHQVHPVESPTPSTAGTAALDNNQGRITKDACRYP